ncbi:Sel1 repeat family protein [Rhizophagus irregularis DAOM 181602=DAOM 197198]|nr:Sel1 repeat family protein [Rhizophagus irregularis DAOM 181602=DAOM 197198]
MNVIYYKIFDIIIGKEYGEEIEQDYFKAFEWYYKSAKNGSAEDYKKSFKCYLKNAESGSADIAMHMYDKETEINIEKAIIWYKKASDNGMKYAKY